MSIFGDLGRRVIEARQKQARIQVAQHLLNLDDATLGRAGFTRAELRKTLGGAR